MTRPIKHLFAGAVVALLFVPVAGLAETTTAIELAKKCSQMAALNPVPYEDLADPSKQIADDNYCLGYMDSWIELL